MAAAEAAVSETDNPLHEPFDDRPKNRAQSSGSVLRARRFSTNDARKLSVASNSKEMAADDEVLVVDREMVKSQRNKAAFVLFLCGFFIIGNLVNASRNSQQASFLTKLVRDTLLGEVPLDGHKAYDDLRTYRDYWTWLQLTFVPVLMPEEWYDGTLIEEPNRGRLELQSYVVGTVRIRQVRVDEYTCNVKLPQLTAEFDPKYPNKQINCYGKYKLGKTAKMGGYIHDGGRLGEPKRLGKEEVCKRGRHPSGLHRIYRRNASRTDSVAAFETDEFHAEQLVLNCEAAYDRCQLSEMDAKCTVAPPNTNFSALSATNSTRYCFMDVHNNAVNRCNAAFKYKTRKELDTGHRQIGHFTTYEGGGFTVELNPRFRSYIDNSTGDESIQSHSRGVISDLKALRWLDQGTRAIFHDFSIYNAQLDLFCSVRLVVEFPATGGAQTSANLQTVQLELYNDGGDYTILALDMTCLVLVTILACRVSVQAYQRPWEALMSAPWILDAALSAFGLSIFGIRVFSVYLAYGVFNEMESVRDNFGEYHIGLHRVAWWFYMDRDVCALAAMLCWARLLGLMLIFPRIRILFGLLIRGIQNILSFLVIFMFAAMAFAHAFYAIFGRNLYSHCTMGTTIFQLVSMLLGNLDEYAAMKDEARFLTPIIFSMFLVTMFFILLNAFIALMSEAFSDDHSRQAEFHYEEDYLDGTLEDDHEFQQSAAEMQKSYARVKLEKLALFDIESMRTVFLDDEDDSILGRVGVMLHAQPVGSGWRNERRLQAVYFSKSDYTLQTSRRWWEKNRHSLLLDEAVINAIKHAVVTLKEKGIGKFLGEVRSFFEVREEKSERRYSRVVIDGASPRNSDANGFRVASTAVIATTRMGQAADLRKARNGAPSHGDVELASWEGAEEQAPAMS